MLFCCFSDANSTENEPDTTHPVVIDLLLVYLLVSSPLNKNKAAFADLFALCVLEYSIVYYGYHFARLLKCLNITLVN